MAPKPQFGGRVRGMFGLVGQSMAVRVPTVTRVITVVDSTFTATKEGLYDFYLYGPGGAGGSSAGSDATHGGGGGAAWKRVFLRAGESVTYHVPDGLGANDPTTITLPDGTVITAEAGQSGADGFRPPGVAKTGLGGDINRTGGRGQGWTNPDTDINTNDGAQINATDGQFGGKAIGSGGVGGGGGAGFTDIFPDLAGNGAPAGYGTTVGGFPGGGGQGNITSNPGGLGGAGALIIVGPR